MPLGRYWRAIDERRRAQVRSLARTIDALISPPRERLRASEDSRHFGALFRCHISPRHYSAAPPAARARRPLEALLSQVRLLKLCGRAARHLSYFAGRPSLAAADLLPRMPKSIYFASILMRLVAGHAAFRHWPVITVKIFRKCRYIYTINVIILIEGWGQDVGIYIARFYGARDYRPLMPAMPRVSSTLDDFAREKAYVWLFGILLTF